MFWHLSENEPSHCNSFASQLNWGEIVVQREKKKKSDCE